MLLNKIFIPFIVLVKLKYTDQKRKVLSQLRQNVDRFLFFFNGTLISGNKKFMRIFAWFTGKGCHCQNNRSGVVDNILIGFSQTPKQIILTDPEWLFYVNE